MYEKQLNLTNLEYSDENVKILSELEQQDDLISDNKSVDSNNTLQSSNTKFNPDSDSKAKCIN